MKINWTPLRNELARWRADGRVLPFWWRDDDAIKPTENLTRLIEISANLKVPVHLAVIPQKADPSLATFLSKQSMAVPAVHGWTHANHAPEGEKSAEFGHPREGAEVELAAGLRHLQKLFGDNLLRFFVVPWNRLHPDFIPALKQAGYLGFSTHTPRPTRAPIAGLQQINTHIDPINWRGDRGLAPADTIIAQVVQNLAERRRDVTDATEPLGYLTHHLVHTPDVWAFSHALIHELLDGGAEPQHLRTHLETPT